MRDKTVLCSVVSEGFVAGFVVMERTLRHHNPDWDAPLVAIYSEGDPISDRSRAIIREHCDNVHFAVARPRIMAPVHEFARDVIGTPERLWPAFSVLEGLTWRFFDRVIALDCDMIVRGPLDPLLHTGAPFSAVRASHHKTDAPMTFFNTGVMVFNRTLLQGFDVARIPKYIGDRRPRPGTGLADQAILNIVMHNRVVGWLPKRFNLTKRSAMIRLSAEDPAALDDPAAIDAWLEAQDTAIFHYVGEKPWNPKVRASEKAYAAMEALWHDAAARFGKRSLFMQMQEQNRQWADRYTAALPAVQRSAGTLSEAAFEKEMGRAMGH